MNYFLYFCLVICPPLVGTIVLESAFHLICKQRRIGGNPWANGRIQIFRNVCLFDVNI